MEVETDDIPEFLLELRIFRQLECTRAMRLQIMSLRFQIVWTVWRETPTSDPAKTCPCRKLHRVRPGGGWVTFTMICSTVSMGTHGLRPRPALSFKPSRPACWKRLDHLLTHGKLTFNRSCHFLGIILFDHLRFSRSRTISARDSFLILTRFELVLELTRRCNSRRSPAVSLRTVIGRAMPYTIASNHLLLNIN